MEGALFRMNVQGAIDEVLVVGEDDWVSAWELRIAAERFMEPDEDTVDAMVEVLRLLLTRRLVRVGDITSDGFEPWPLEERLLVEHACQRLAAVGDGMIADDPFWLCNTELGDQVARELIANGYELPE